ncbi:DUF938 domain-containing protein [Porticoccus sp. W117]|uniref:DUF938 domain-containing protein n=1 Tax=Porticoccus sp. W117 TaxID=3054777 RepID=UPI00259A5ED3|nr:DUF938 domain-containing protein [Porticoccus sp. W117]MDM3870427.1 DUF938 domain-containing protein [Porticoccus sp. W117]
MDKPFSQACENNKSPILDVLKEVFAQSKKVLEVGSGTGQHAVFFAPQLPHLQWHTSDLPDNHSGINHWIDECPSDNLYRPLLLDADMPKWNLEDIDGVFTANTCHIMSWQSVQNLFARVGKILQPGGRFCIYGPFNYNGQYTSESNASFDVWLKEQAPHRAIRDFESINELAEKRQMKLVDDYEMPANNRLLVFEKHSG